MKIIRPLGGPSDACGLQDGESASESETDRQTDITKLIIAFRYYMRKRPKRKKAESHIFYIIYGE